MLLALVDFTLKFTIRKVLTNNNQTWLKNGFG